MKKAMLVGAVAALALVCGRGGGGDPHGKKGDGMGVVFVTPAKVKWVDAPPVLPPGAKVALLQGDPAKPGPFVMRVRLPDGYRVPPHTHPKRESVTVLSGTLYVGMGDTFDPKKGREMPAGAYGSWPEGMSHYVWAKGETVIQVNASGPWALNYVNPKDDPRNAKK
jgi:quercetin dioxygenase-like cupin family protein